MVFLEFDFVSAAALAVALSVGVSVQLPNPRLFTAQRLRQPETNGREIQKVTAQQSNSYLPTNGSTHFYSPLSADERGKTEGRNAHMHNADACAI